MSELQQETLERIQKLRKEIDDAIVRQNLACVKGWYTQGNGKVTVKEFADTILALNACLKAEMKFYNNLP